MRVPHFVRYLTVALPFGAAGILELHAQATGPENAGSVEFFEKKIRPILSSHCYSCHSADTKPAGGLRVDDRNGLLWGGDEGPGVVPGDPSKSLIVQRLHIENAKRRMPKEGDPLTDAEEADLVAWIKAGAAWPRENYTPSAASRKPEFADLKAHHWAWQPLTRPMPPAVQDTGWPRSNIDHFILAKLEAEHLPPVGDADRLTLLRRVTYDLTGLPPSPEEIEQFLADSSSDAFARVVDRLLNSPSYGERWGRHWLDVARYGESTGPSRNIPYPHAWRYRDYVLDAVNRDIPFNRFIEEQIAGDLLPAANSDERDRLLTATGFLALGVKDVNQRFKVRFVMDNVDEQIDTVTRSVLGLTVSCARCHDHKFDPITQADYYSLAGIFTSTDDCAGVRNKMGGGGLDYYVPSMLLPLSSTLPPPPADQVEKLTAQVAAAKKAFDEIRGTPEGLAKGPNGQPKQRKFRQQYERLQGQLAALTDPAARGNAVHGVRDAKTVGDTEIRIRGEAERLGPTVPRGFLNTFTVPGAASVNPAQSGRLELAEWLTSPANPLTPRVIVSRAWERLFGVGIVNTVDNFGVKGDRPSHPELLDYLANQFVRDGWSMKKLIRSLVLTHAYQLGVDAPQDHHEIDPANRLVWRHSPRRLEAEEVRDAMLLTSGRLQSKPASGTPVKDLRMIEMRDNGPEAASIRENSDTGLYRSVYLPLLRGVTPHTLEAFDPVEQTLVTGRRDTTTVPTQALFLLNSTFVRQEALALAQRVLSQTDRTDEQRITELYLLTVGRSPRPAELARNVAFLKDYEHRHQRVNHEEEAAPKLASNAETPADNTTDTETGGAQAAAAKAAANPDDIDVTDVVTPEHKIQTGNPRETAWMNLAQALYASAEFLFVR